MTDHTTSKDDQYAPDEPSAHRFTTGRVGVGKTDRLIELPAASSDHERPNFIDPKGVHDSLDGGGDHQ